MSTMTQARRKLSCGPPPIKGNYAGWLKSAKTQIEGLFKVSEYFKHRSHQKALERAANREPRCANGSVRRAACEGM